MNRALVTAIIVLPGTVLAAVPALILSIADSSNFFRLIATPHRALFWLALLPAGAGFGLAVWTVTLLLKLGDGTPAPWDPPKRLVVRGPYCHVRNPMISGVLLMLLAESLFFQSWPLALWMTIFYGGNALYLPLGEEKDLEKRFGADYRKYKNHVPRWIPRLRPWHPEKGQA
jgi:protein-S-isoprenylcysteine O-methyltransferase Ste14